MCWACDSLTENETRELHVAMGAVSAKKKKLSNPSSLQTVSSNVDTTAQSYITTTTTKTLNADGSVTTTTTTVTHSVPINSLQGKSRPQRNW